MFILLLIIVSTISISLLVKDPIFQVPIYTTVEDKSITNDRSNNTKNDRRKARLKSETTKARRELKRSVFINELTQVTRAK